MFQEITQYLADHPVILSSIGVFVVLAVIGAWYVLAHHLGVLLVTLLSAAGFASGVLVLYRGWQEGMRDLMAVGGFLIIVFPLIYQQAIRVAKVAYGPDPVARGHAKRAGV